MPVFHQQSREELRQMYIDAWHKFREGRILEPLEAQIASVIAEHPEYHALFESPDGPNAEFPPEAGQSNPFLHLGLHLAIREQIGTDRPAGIAKAHEQLARRLGSAQSAEHQMVEALAETLWEAQRNGLAPDEQSYLRKIERL